MVSVNDGAEWAVVVSGRCSSDGEQLQMVVVSPSGAQVEPNQPVQPLGPSGLSATEDGLRGHGELTEDGWVGREG